MFVRLAKAGVLIDSYTGDSYADCAHMYIVYTETIYHVLGGLIYISSLQLLSSAK